MGTRSLTTITSNWPEQDKDHHATIYRHWDGYLDGHGADLAGYLENVVVTNGVLMGQEDDGKVRVNGPGRLAAYIISRMYADDVSPDLMPEGTDAGQEYHYVLHVSFDTGGGEIEVTVYDGPMTAFGFGGEECKNKIFSGTVAEYQQFLKDAEDAEEEVA